MTTPSDEKQCFGRGLLVAIVGVDLCGKSTQITRLVQWYSKRGVIVASVGLSEKPNVETVLAISKERNPTPQFFPFGLSPDHYAMAYNYDFLNHYWRNVVPLQKTNVDLVLSDRYMLCYQGYAYAVGAESEFCYTFLKDIVRPPELQICIDLDVEVALNRLKKRGKRELDETEYILRRLVEFYRRACKTENNIIMIDGDKPIDKVTQELVKIIDVRLRNVGR
jgi:thymidylate kinase